MKQGLFIGKPINGIIPQGKTWTLLSGASPGEFNHTLSSAEAEREGGLKGRQNITTTTGNR
ncbi:MAG: hypothetical protein ABR519_03045 [Bacteroidales bacterium]